MTLNDNEVQRQIRHMMAFIDQEAREKVEEIDAKAEEEFQIEKSRLVQNQRLKIMEYYSRKEKQIELSKKIQDSNLKNQSRLQVLQSRENHIEMLLKEARMRLKRLSGDQNRYGQCLSGLIIEVSSIPYLESKAIPDREVFEPTKTRRLSTQIDKISTSAFTKDLLSHRGDLCTSTGLVKGLFQILEPEVIIRCRQSDRNLVESLLPGCVATYRKQTGINGKVTIDQTYLPESIAGGVELVNKDGRIKVVNTLESRLDQISERMMPQLREILFGVNESRKFRN